MDLKNLQCFIAVAEQLNFSRAAQNLYISQPSLSIRISALEDELGVKLFNRTHQQVYLTNEGAVLLPAAREIMEKVHALHFLVNGAPDKNDVPQKLYIGIDVTEDRSLPVFENTISHFQQQHPDMDIRVTSLYLDEYEKRLLNGEMDFCLMVLQEDTPVNPLFLSIPLLTEPMVMVTKDAGNLSVDELIRTREIQLLFEGERGIRWNEQYMEFLKNYTLDIQPTYIENVSLLCMNLRSGKTITFLPQTFVESLNDPHLSIIPASLPQRDITLTLLWNKLNINPMIQLLVNDFQSNIKTRS